MESEQSLWSYAVIQRIYVVRPYADAEHEVVVFRIRNYSDEEDSSGLTVVQMGNVSEELGAGATVAVIGARDCDDANLALWPSASESTDFFVVSVNYLSK